MAEQPEMTELEILIAIHRAIDEAASQSRAAQAIAARYVPAYASPGAVGWTQTLDVALGPPPEAKKLVAKKVDETPKAEKKKADEPARGTERA